MRKALVIMNPVAGKGEGLKHKSWIVEKLGNSSIDFDYVESTYEGEIEKLTHELDMDKFSEIIVIGGDGTLVEAINGIKGRDIKLGLIPVGTGNDFARTLSGEINPRNALDSIIDGNFTAIDLGRVNDKYFVNVTGFGIDSYILANMVIFKKFLGGSLAYLASTLYTLFKFKSKKVKLHINGEVLEREIMLAAISNGQYFGGGMKISPNAKVDDGEFELVLVNKISIIKFLSVFQKVYKGTHLTVSEVEVFKSKAFFIESEESIPINVDGNLYGSTPIDVKVSDVKVKMYC